MKRGPKPVPTKLKLARGSRRAINLAEPKPERSRPRCPSHLSDAAKAEWRRISVQLFRIGLLTDLDGPALSLYCVAFARWVEAIQKVTETGLVVTTDKGNVIQNPYLAVANKAAKQMHEMLLEFGMTPSSRTRVTAAKDGGAFDSKAHFFPDFRGSRA